MTRRPCAVCGRVPVEVKLYGYYLLRAQEWDRLIARGWKFQEIAERTMISVKTVRETMRKYWSQE